MKVIVVLALAVFTGCQANIFYADEPKPQLEQLTDAFWSYVAKATQTAEDTVKMIRSSQLGQEVNSRLTQSADMASEYAVTLKKQMDPMAEELMSKITKEAEVLRERLGQDLTSVRDKLEPYADNLKSQIQQRVEELRTAMAPYADSLDSETLKATLLQKSEELRGNLEQSVKELQAQLEPYTADIKEKVDQRLQEFQKTVNPLTEDLQTQIRERAQMVQQSLTPYAEDLKEKLDPYAQDLQAQLTALYAATNFTLQLQTGQCEFKHTNRPKLEMMKILLVIALVVCTGCQANLFYADEPKPKLNQLADAFRSYFERVKNRTSQLGQEINQYTTNLKEQMDPLTKDLMNKITKGSDVLRERIEVEISTVRCALKPYIESVTSPFEKGADYIRKSLDYENLKATVLQKSEELRERVEQGVKELEAKLNPST
ncbi:hypothetical protein Q8A67_007805 [Cirrhinus molitorella]|uniref:Apolipoprotein A-IV n=1 Tax=Cirrhinus molitorella TaxID=172907 RepID=A0AA88PW62_9TELE|nr:hypothetical protein Q8A67_007805 [Cirrhinus molitorella]